MSITKGAEPSGFTALPIEQAVYVPSTNKQQKFIGIGAFDSRVNETRKKLHSLFGGSTSINAIWGFTDSYGRLIKEKVVKITSNSVVSGFKPKQRKLIMWLKSKKRLWGQEAIGYEVETDLFFIK